MKLEKYRLHPKTSVEKIMSDLSHILSDESLPQRLDKALVVAFADQGYSRTRLQQLVAQGMVQVNGVVVANAAQTIGAGTVLSLTLPPPLATTMLAQALPLAILYEDEAMLVLDKPPGLVVHPAAGHYDHTLVNALLAHCGTTDNNGLSGIGGVARPGIVHRLDKDTSGLMVVAKHDRAHAALSAQFADRSLSRTYQAFVWDMPHPPQGSVDLAIGRDAHHRQKMVVRPLGGGKTALTHYAVAEYFGTRAALVTCTLSTGRTHQIRVHLAHLGHAVIGDAVYGRARRGTDRLTQFLRRFPRQALHASALKLLHPMTKKPMSFTTTLPPDLRLLHGELRAIAKIT
jgi:23S rRNA pseudouridine1911/1915/1917 synthase